MIVTVRVPDGYASAEEFARDCQFEIVDISPKYQKNRLIDRREMRARRLTMWMLNILRDCIPRDSFRTAERTLFDLAYHHRLHVIEISAEHDAIEDAQIEAMHLASIINRPPIFVAGAEPSA